MKKTFYYNVHKQFLKKLTLTYQNNLKVSKIMINIIGNIYIKNIIYYFYS